jgi:hypothetical protein
MRLESSVFVARPAAAVWEYVGNVEKVSEWDRGVAATRVTSSVAAGVGLEFDTLARRNGKASGDAWGKMSYRVADIDQVRGCTVELTSRDGNARYFKRASWRFRVEEESGGSRVYCTAEFKLRLRYIVLGPVLFGMRSAIRRDLESLKRAVEAVGS